MTLFENKEQISRRKLRESLRKAPSRIPGTTRRFYRRERIELEKEFGKGYGSHISKREVKKHLWELKRERYKAKTLAEKVKIDDKIRYFKKRGGFK